MTEDWDTLDASDVALNDQLETEVKQGARIAGCLYRELKGQGIPRKLRMGLTAAWFHGWLEGDEQEDDDEE